MHHVCITLYKARKTFCGNLAHGEALPPSCQFNPLLHLASSNTSRLTNTAFGSLPLHPRNRLSLGSLKPAKATPGAARCLWAASERVTPSTAGAGSAPSRRLPPQAGGRRKEGRKGFFPHSSSLIAARERPGGGEGRGRSGERCRRGRQVRSAGRPRGARGDGGASPARGTCGGRECPRAGAVAFQPFRGAARHFLKCKWRCRGCCGPGPPGTSELRQAPPARGRLRDPS